MSFALRAQVTLMALLLLGLGALGMGVGVGWVDLVGWLGRAGLFPAWPWLAMGLGLVLLLFSLRVLLTTWQRPAQAAVLVLHNDSGLVHISQAALASMVMRAGREVRGLKETRPRLRLSPEGVAVSLRTTVWPEASVPEVAQELQARVKAHLEDLAGIKVREVQVVVDGISEEVRNRVE